MILILVNFLFYFLIKIFYFIKGSPNYQNNFPLNSNNNLILNKLNNNSNDNNNKESQNFESNNYLYNNNNINNSYLNNNTNRSYESIYIYLLKNNFYQ